MKDIVKAGRIAIRHEGEFVNAYWALPNSMDDAILLASIRYALVDADNAIWETFKAMIQDAAKAFIKSQMGLDASFDHEAPAPEYERSGHA